MPGGSANDYLYGYGDPVNGSDTNGREWTSNVKKIAREWGVTEEEVRDQIHDAKQDLPRPRSGAPRNPDIEVNTKTGEWRVKGTKEVQGSLAVSIAFAEDSAGKPVSLKLAAVIVGASLVIGGAVVSWIRTIGDYVVEWGPVLL